MHKSEKNLPDTGTTSDQTDSGQRVFTLQELARHDGQNGAPAYLAINGVIYDVTRVQLLKDGRHHGVAAGSDVSELFVHNQAILNRLQVIGTVE
jgi:predicted heme/steroid binding protein